MNCCSFVFFDVYMNVSNPVSHFLMFLDTYYCGYREVTKYRNRVEFNQ